MATSVASQLAKLRKEREALEKREKALQTRTHTRAIEKILAIAKDAGLSAADISAAMGGGKTFAASYIDNVNDLGNVARQAAISQSALTVVYDQAVSARDQVSGVSLDEEAADLVRYQQAYQAAAKILQVASQLFDSVLQVR